MPPGNRCKKHFTLRLRHLNRGCPSAHAQRWVGRSICLRETSWIVAVSFTFGCRLPVIAKASKVVS